jgi:hypothetical protein
MSFLFKSKQKNPNPNALPPASRDIRSSDGPAAAPASQIPTLNGIVNGAKPASPTPGSSVNNSLASLPGNEQTGRPSGGSGSLRQSEEKPAYPAEDAARATGSPSPEQKSIRSMGENAAVCPDSTNA